MKLSGVIVALIGGVLFAWHLIKIWTGNDAGSPPFTHHIMSLIGGILMFAGIFLYVTGKRRGRGAN